MALDPKRRRAIELLAAGNQQQRDIAQTLNVTEESLSRWKAEPEFAAELAKAIDDIAGEARSIIKGSVARAALRLASLIDSTDERIARQACIDILDRAGVAPVKQAEAVADRPATPEELREAQALIQKLASKSKANE